MDSVEKSVKMFDINKRTTLLYDSMASICSPNNCMLITSITASIQAPAY